MAYVTGAEAPEGGYEKPAGCPFCVAQTRPDEEKHIVARGESVFAILNLYPYNPGHLLICPYRHVADYTELDDAETAELTAFTRTSLRVIRHASRPHGFYLGM